jgi:hypothetical protein
MSLVATVVPDADTAQTVLSIDRTMNMAHDDDERPVWQIVEDVTSAPAAGTPADESPHPEWEAVITALGYRRIGPWDRGPDPDHYGYWSTQVEPAALT